ncbi:MAG: hypothetical protein JXR27_08860 [Paludibacteraceae bacterium]|nr:hypothetical protein [Paludibacteraceae bacterium]
MSFNPFRLLVLLATMLTIVSCDWLDTEEETEVSTNPSFASLRFTSSDYRVSTAYFTVVKEDDIQDSIVVNLDSLPYNTDISKLVSTYSFSSVANTYAFVTDSLGGIDTINISATTEADTIDYRWGVRLKNYAANGIDTASYIVKVNVHTVEPELYQWNRVQTSLFSHPGSQQKAILFNDSIFFYTGSGISNTLYSSKDGYDWTPAQNIAGLPENSQLRNLVVFKNKIYYAHADSSLYITENGRQWTQMSFATQSFHITSLLFQLSDTLHAVAQQGTDHYFAFSHDGTSWQLDKKVPTGFPVTGYAALSFHTRTNVPRAIVVGGYTANENIMQNIWTTENAKYWIDFSTEKTNLDYLAGASLITYDNKILLIGRMNDEGLVHENWYLESKDEGLSWNTPDTTYNQVRELMYNPTDTSYIYMEPRYLTSAIVRDKRIIIIGGRDHATFFSDVWIGKLNRLSFLRQ